MYIINHVTKYRIKANLTQEQLACLCDVSRQTINSIENLKSLPNIYLAYLIAVALSTPIDELFKLSIQNN